MSQGKRVLFLRPDKAGDAIKTLPVLRALRAVRPQWMVSILVSKHNESIFRLEPGVATVVDSRLDSEESFDIAINLLCDPSEESIQFLQSIKATKKAGVKRKGQDAGFTAVRLRRGPQGQAETHNIADLVSQALKLTEPLPFDKFDARPILSDEDRVEATKTMGKKEGKWLGICPLAGGKDRFPPLGRWAKFITYVSQRADFDRVFVFCPFGQRQTLLNVLPSRCEAWIASPSSFRAMGAYFERLDGVAAVDSGPLHLARAMNIPSLGILSGGDVGRWFSEFRSQDFLLRRGLLDRFPMGWEIRRSYNRWKSLLF